LQTAGVHEGGKIGVVGWKSFTDKDASGENTWLDIPSYIADTVRSIVGEHGEVTNITDTDITDEIIIYYKNSATDILYGGITYRVRVSGGIPAGETVRVMSRHYHPDRCTIVMVTCGA
jgi:hypothetical protein